MFVKKVLSLMICLAMTVGMFIVPSVVQAEGEAWDGTADYSWYDEQESAYTISTPAQFAAFGNILNKLDDYDDRFAGKTITLTADLDMGNQPFCAMGGQTKGQEFGGTFEGKGHIIKNLNINKLGYDGSNCAALFACVRAATIHNLGLENVTVNIPQNGVTYQGAFVGYVMGDTQTTIENCFVRDVNINVTTPISGGKIGGFAGYVTPWNVSHVVKNCYSLNVHFSKNGESNDVGFGFGHFAGATEDKGSFINCYSGGVPTKPADSTLPGKILPFGMVHKSTTTVTNCYSDCYMDESALAWYYNQYNTKNAVSQISTADLKGMTGGVALGAGFVKAKNDTYNYGYPFLEWEEKYVARKPQPTGTFEIVSHEQTEDQLYNVTVSALEGDVEYRYVAYGNPGAWQDSNVFTNLPSGKYTFEARTKEDAEIYPSKEITTEEITFKISSVWNGTAFDYSWYKDHSSPYTIETPEQFAAFGNIVNHKDGYSDTFAGKTINLTADLDMGNKDFSAMGGAGADKAFSGTFEGKGHIISNLNIAKAGSDGVSAALFAEIRDGAVKDLGLESVTIAVPGATRQAAFAGRLIGSNGATVENCFVRDVTFIINDDITLRRIGGFVAEVSEYPASEEKGYNKVTNCYAVNVAFTGTGSNDWALGFFAGTSDGGMVTNCYSGGTLTNTDGFKVEKFGRFNVKKAQVNSCYSDSDNKGKTIWPGGDFGSKGSKVSASALKSTVDMGEGFQRIVGTPYNYGYPFLAWEASRAAVVEGAITMHKVTDSLSGEAGEDITPVAFSDTYDAVANSTFDLVFDQDVDLSTVTKEAVTFNGKAADAVTTDSANTKRVRVTLNALIPLTRGRLKVCGVKNAAGKYMKDMELCFTTAGTGATGDYPVISSFELVENYAAFNEASVAQEADLAGKTITAVAGGLYNNTDTANFYTLMLARYNGKGMLEDVVMNTYELGAHAYLSESGTSSAGGSAEPTKVELTVPADSKGNTVKAFAWERKSMKPLWKSLDAREPIKLLIIGNSITKHEPAPEKGWYHDWGMAATAESKDYVHQLAAKAEKVAPVTVKPVGLYDFEKYFYNFDKIDHNLYREAADFNPDIIICTIGANIKNPTPEGDGSVNTEEVFTKERYADIINYFNKNNAKVIVGTTKFVAEEGEIEAAIKAYADETGAPYVKMNDMNDEAYSARPYADQFPDGVLAGVLDHPGDAGMAEMANRLWEKLHPVMEQCLAGSASGAEN